MAITKVSPLAFREVSENYVPVLIKGERKKNHIISPILIKFLKRHPARKSLVAQWLGLCASIAGGLGLIPGQRIKILPGSACTHAQSLQSCPTFCDPIDCSPPGSSVHADSPCKNTGVVAIPFSRDLPNPGIEPTSLPSPALAGRFFTTSTTWEAHKAVGMVKKKGD